MAFQGIDIRQTGDRIVFRASLKDSTGAVVTTGTANLRVYELQSDGSLKSYDWSSNTFKTLALTTESQAMTHRTGNNSTTNTGLWTYALTTLTGFTAGNIYIAKVVHASTLPAEQEREFQFGVSSAFDMYDTVRGGLTALPNAVAGANGGLPLGDAAGRVDLGKWLGTAVTLSSGVPDVNIKTITAAIIASASFAANALDAVWSTVTRTITGGTIGTYTGNTPQTGDAFARLGAPAGASHAADIAAVAAKTVNLPPDPADASDIAAATSALASTLAGIAAKTTNLPSDPADASDIATATNAIAASIAALMTTAMAESYSADGATMTPAQALYMIVALLSEFSIAGTTLSAHKKDGTTVAATFTLDSATSPTSITRTT